MREYLRPGSPQEAAEAKRQNGDRAVYLAGGSDLLVHRPDTAEVAIDIRHAGMGYVMDGDEAMVIGGAALLRDAELAVTGLAGDMLRLAFRDTAPWLIRNAATVAGNIANASPAADAVPALLALDACLVLDGDESAAVPVESVLVGPHRTSLGDRLITEIRIPEAAAARRGAFIKLARSKSDIAQVNVAVTFKPDLDGLRDVRIALGAVAPTAMRATGAEALLEGQAPSADLLTAVGRAVAEEVRPISDWRASEQYRRRMSAVLVRRALERMLDGV